MPSEEITSVSPRQGGAGGFLLNRCDSLRSESMRMSFEDLRSVKWRIHLGILPSSSTVDDLRRVTADFRRRYASLRRRLLVDTHVPKDGSNSPDLVIDNPLSQNPDSTWSRFFRNAELEKMVDQDLSRLYPEHGSYFQTPGCQGILRRILLLWCLRHPEYGYKQGMHELLAPLLFVLQVDVEHLSEVRKLHEDHFTDKFDGLAFEENDFTYNFDLKNSPEFTEEDIGSHRNPKNFSSLNELDSNVRTIVLLSDAYGAEGELGIVLSDKFMEHDAYCMFDALMSGSRGAVAMADFFSISPAAGSHTGLPPIIEASLALYHLLSMVDSSLHSHLVELGVEPQYFALRWLRVMFGREFSLEDLLKIWDEIFASDNSKIDKNTEDAFSGFGVLNSQRGAFISAIAVSMILHLRSSLLATENITKCLQRLLNFPQNVSLKKLIAKAKSLQTLALESNVISTPPSFGSGHHRSKSAVVTGHNSSSNSVSPATSLVPDSYWEEKWRFMQKAEELSQNTLVKLSPSNKKRWSDKVRLSLSRTESAPSPSKTVNGKSTVRRSLLEDLSRELGLEEDEDKLGCEELFPGQNSVPTESGEQVCTAENATSTAEAHLSGNAGSEDNSSLFSVSTSPHSEPNEQENNLEQSSVASNLTVDVNDDDSNNGESFQAQPEIQLPVSDPPEDLMESQLEGSVESKSNNDIPGKLISGAKDRRSLSGKFPWFWKFGRNSADTGTPEKDGGLKVSEVVTGANSKSGSSTVDKPCNSSPSIKGDNMDQNVMVTLRNLGQSMLDNIQIIESAFQQDRAQMGLSDGSAKNFIVGKGQGKAVAALKELRKISNLLSEM